MAAWRLVGVTVAAVAAWRLDGATVVAVAAWRLDGVTAVAAAVCRLAGVTTLLPCTEVPTGVIFLPGVRLTVLPGWAVLLAAATLDPVPSTTAPDPPPAGVAILRFKPLPLILWLPPRIAVAYVPVGRQG